MSNAQTMKIYSIISKIEQKLEDSPKKKFSNTNERYVDVDVLFDLLGDLKVTIPEDIRRASGIIAEEENTLRDAHEFADELRARADEEAEELRNQAQDAAEKVYRRAVEEYEARISETSVMQEANYRAQQLLADAEENSNQICEGARRYADDVLADVQRYLTEYIRAINVNRQEIDAKPEPIVPVKDTLGAALPQQEEQFRPQPQPQARPAKPAPQPQPAEPEEEEEDYIDYEETKEQPKKKGWFRRMLEGDGPDEDDEDWDDEQPTEKKTKKKHKLFEFVEVADDEEEE